MNIQKLFSDKKDLSTFIKFCIVGGLGTITNLVIFYFLADLLNLQALVASTICFLVAASQNYFLNGIFSFKEKFSGYSFKQYFKFILVSLLGLVINLLTLSLLLKFYNFKYKIFPQAIGILFGTIINFIGSKIFVFIKKELKSEDSSD